MTKEQKQQRGRDRRGKPGSSSGFGPNTDSDPSCHSKATGWPSKSTSKQKKKKPKEVEPNMWFEWSPPPGLGTAMEMMKEQEQKQVRAKAVSKATSKQKPQKVDDSPNLQQEADGKKDGLSLEDSLGAHIPVVRLRGLPCSASEKDVFEFFSMHNVAEGIVEGANAVKILLKANGRPSGQASVQMRNRHEAAKAQKILHSQWIGNRYIEVLAYGGNQSVHHRDVEYIHSQT